MAAPELIGAAEIALPGALGLNNVMYVPIGDELLMMTSSFEGYWFGLTDDVPVLLGSSGDVAGSWTFPQCAAALDATRAVFVYRQGSDVHARVIDVTDGFVTVGSAYSVIERDEGISRLDLTATGYVPESGNTADRQGAAGVVQTGAGQFALISIFNEIDAGSVTVSSYMVVHRFTVAGTVISGSGGWLKGAIHNVGEPGHFRYNQAHAITSDGTIWMLEEDEDNTTDPHEGRYYISSMSAGGVFRRDLVADVGENWYIARIFPIGSSTVGAYVYDVNDDFTIETLTWVSLSASGVVGSSGVLTADTGIGIAFNAGDEWPWETSPKAAGTAMPWGQIDYDTNTRLFVGTLDALTGAVEKSIIEGVFPGGEALWQLNSAGVGWTVLDAATGVMVVAVDFGADTSVLYVKNERYRVRWS